MINNELVEIESSEVSGRHHLDVTLRVVAAIICEQKHHLLEDPREYTLLEDSNEDLPETSLQVLNNSRRVLGMEELGRQHLREPPARSNESRGVDEEGRPRRSEARELHSGGCSEPMSARRGPVEALITNVGRVPDDRLA